MRTGRYMGGEAAARMVGSYSPGVVIRIEPDGPSGLRAWDYADE